MTGTSSRVAIPGIDAESYTLTKVDFDWVRARIKASAGIDLAPGKMDLVVGRISRRLRALGLDGFASYKALLESGHEGDEEREFVNALTTNVTSFFREAHHFHRLGCFVEERVKQRGSDGLRLWSAGCSSGEEPYSISITLLETLQHRTAPADFKILATDIDTQILDQARTGIYPTERVAGLEASCRQRWFLKGRGPRAGLARVRPAVAEPVSFRQLNLMQEWSKKLRFDGIFCRNVMIYFDQAARDKLVDRFAQALKPGGCLFIGHSETIDPNHRLLEPLGQTVYRRRQGAR